ncbi:MAG: histidine kinase [Saprospiraceae bacterium]|nr:histidine kinase [Saprospiraceae bacterium]
MKLRNEKIRRLELEAALKEAQLNTLKGQINPHFMFNSLNNIRALILENPHKSREMLTSLSEMLRASLNADMTDTITVREELETVKNFIALSTIQMEDRLHYEQEVDDQFMDARIPLMMLQLVIENAIKHGISTLPEGGTVKLSITESENKLLISVSNDGRLLW